MTSEVDTKRSKEQDQFPLESWSKVADLLETNVDLGLSNKEVFFPRKLIFTDHRSNPD